jgi:AcrR family transcriptional regulator
MAAVKPRTYRSTVREEQAKATRRRVLDAALHLFTDAGYHGATIEAIAAEAGVAVPTVYKAFGTKGALLREAVQLAVTGDEEREPLMQRPWWREQLAEPDAAEQLRLVARNMRSIWGRAAPIVEMVRTAATLDSETADVWRAVNDDRFERSRVTAKNLINKGGIRQDLSPSAVADILLNMTGLEMYLLFVRDRGWSESRFEAWTADALQSLLLER